MFGRAAALRSPIETTNFSWVGGVFKEELGLARTGGGCWLVKEEVMGISKPMGAMKDWLSDHGWSF